MASTVSATFWWTATLSNVWISTTTSKVGGAFRSRMDFWVPPPPRLLVAQGHRLDAADEVGEGRVHHQVLQGVAVGGGDELHAALGDGAGGRGLQLRADLVDD